MPTIAIQKTLSSDKTGLLREINPGSYAVSLHGGGAAKWKKGKIEEKYKITCVSSMQRLTGFISFSWEKVTPRPKL
jgi:hypothetical protein